MKNEIEVWLKIPEGFTLKGCRTDGDTAIAVFAPIVNHTVIGFVPPPPEEMEEEEDNEEYEE